MKKSSLRRADLVFTLFLMLVSVWTMLESVKMFFNPFARPFAKVSGEDIKNSILNWYMSPALMPFIFAACLLLCSILLYLHARNDGARFDFFTKEKVKSFFQAREFKVASLIIVIMTFYVFALVPFCRAHFDYFHEFQGFPFMIASFICILTQTLIFGKRTPPRIALGILISAVAAAAITYGFGVLAMIPLP